MSDQDQDQDQDGGDHESDDLNHEYSASNDDFPVSADESLANTRATNNNCPCLPTQQQKEISQALFKVPEGFQALLKHITRELLNAKPKDPYVYIADFLRSKVNDKRRGLLEQEFFRDDTLNIDIKPPMHYLGQTSLANVTCPSTTAFDALASDAATTLQAKFRGMQGRGEMQEVKRDPERVPQFGGDQQGPNDRRRSSTGAATGSSNNNDVTSQDLCGKITPAVLQGCGYGGGGQQKQQQQQQQQRRGSQQQGRGSAG